MADQKFRLMAIHAHPDDESSKGAATMAKYAREGVDVLVVSCTGGERGDVLNPSFAADPEMMKQLPELRRHEMEEAAKALGVRHAWLGFVDSGLPEGDPLPPLPEGCFALQDVNAAAKPLVKLIRDFRPQVATTYDETGGYPHPDHIMCHKVSIAAIRQAADPDYAPELGEPWRVSKVYYDHGFAPERIRALHEAMVNKGLESPFEEWVANAADRPDRSSLVTTRVEVADYFDQRDAALRAHATQIDPNGFFFAVPRDIEKTVWPTEEFELAHSTVPTTIPEDDLFAGLR